MVDIGVKSYIEKDAICLKDYNIRPFLSIRHAHGDLCKHLGIDSSTDLDDWYSNLFQMPRLHLPRLSYDLFVYYFPCDFFGIVGGYKLRRMCLHCLRSPYDFFRWQTRTKPYRDLADIVRQPQGYRTIIVLSSRPPYINRTMPIR